MDIQEQINLHFHGVDISNVNYGAFKPIDSNAKVNLEVFPKVFYPDDNTKEFKIIMEVIIKSVDYFDISILAIGHFELGKELKEDLKKIFVNQNAPAIMFPYVRAFVATFSSNLGSILYPINLPTQFFKGELEEFKNENPNN